MLSSNLRLFSPPGATHFCPKAGIAVINRLPPPSTQRLGLPRVYASPPTPGTGIFTRCPSPTLSSLGLGPTNPTRTGLPSETLDVRRTWFSHVFRYSCQHSHFCPLQSSLPDDLHRKQNAPLLQPLLQGVPSFGGRLEPRCIIRAIAFDQ